MSSNYPLGVSDRDFDDTNDAHMEYMLHLDDLLEQGEGALIGTVRLDATVRVWLTKRGRDGEPEITELEIKDVFLVQPEPSDARFNLVQPFLLDRDHLEKTNKLLWQDFVAEIQRLALERARTTDRWMV